jgi:hypothetical protein
MKEPMNTCGGATVLFERLADDGWPDDAGCWPIGWTSPPVPRSHEPIQGIRGLSPSRFIKSLWRNSQSNVIAVASRSRKR